MDGPMSKIAHVPTAAMGLAAFLAVTTAAAEPIGSGSGRQTAVLGNTQIPVFTYRPAGCADPSLLLVFHGAERNAEDYHDYARGLADRNCMLVVAPLFAQHTFPSWRYQRGGIVDKKGKVRDPRDWTGRLVPDLVDWVRSREGRPLPYSLIAHSAGGQFLSRLAAFIPTEARRIVLANAGTYVLPSLAVDAPYGLGKIYAGADGEQHLQRYLQQPVTIYLGAADTADDTRNNSPEARAQGASRHARGLNVFAAGKALAQSRGWPFNWRLVELPGVGHDGQKMLAAPQASDALIP
jgi:pimeloyl-ACP methyl ester carboxylesterase